ncbi:MAG TPA: Nramp family divalent metal transporter, partial [Planctomycetaceae bacterium]|nr:Nramp family divalent metal transporter [Planctomycetaceae bacterium]
MKRPTVQKPWASGVLTHHGYPTIDHSPSAIDQPDLVPDEVIPHQHLPPLKYRDMPEPIPWTRMVGPSIILAGLALGSGEYILWPRIAYTSGFVFFWAAMLGIITQYFVNLEIERWT